VVSRGLVKALEKMDPQFPERDDLDGFDRDSI
jgi:hypothetical protein